jgi:hypothetical protein
MKTFYSCLFILTFFISCDSDSKSESKNTSDSAIANRIMTELPGNIDNPYDEVGWVHNEIFESYYASGINPTTISGIVDRVEALADANGNFKVIKTTTYQPVSVTRVQYILDRKSSCVTDVISNSSLTLNAKLSLSTFINALVATFETESNCDVLYNYVVAYEKSVISNSIFTVKDKQIMLITTSVARHSVYLAKKRPKKNTDPDWTVLILHLASVLDGAEKGMAEGVTEGLVTGIASNP